MQRLKQKFQNPAYPIVLIPLIAFVGLSFGTVIGKLGIYWDDWAYIWTRLELGFHGLLRHFSFSRPVAGQIHNIAILLTDGSPIKIQLYGLFFQVFGSFCFGALLKTIWKDNDFAAALGALLFLSYPGFTMRPIAINFSFSYFLLGILFISFMLSYSVIRCESKRFLKTAAALLIALLNLFASEYFFLLELLRPCLFWLEFRSEEQPVKVRIKRTIQAEFPYAAVFLAGMCYRLFFNKTQTLHYNFSLMDKLKTDPLEAFSSWIANIGHDCVRVIFSGWGNAFAFPNAESFGHRSTLVYGLICVLTAAAAFTILILLRQRKVSGNHDTAFQMIILGLIAMVLGGQPFWLTESSINFVFPNCRYTLPFIPGISLVLCGMILLLKKLPRVQIFLTAILIGLAAGSQFIAANEYRRDWTLTKDFFWQLKWRAPEIEENTVVVSNVLPIRFSTDNSLTAPLNWIYADSYETDRIPYMLYTNTKRENSLSGLTAGKEIFQEYLSAQFFGNTNDMLSVSYHSPGCVHVLDPEIDIFNQTIPELDREGALLNNYKRIRSQAAFRPLPEKLFGKEPAHTWCWYYETADLARQNQDWEKVSELGDTAFTLNDHPNDPMELIPFIEGYANVSRWDDAVELTQKAINTTPVMNNPLCALWNRIEKDTSAKEAKDIMSTLDCGFLR